LRSTNALELYILMEKEIILGAFVIFMVLLISNRIKPVVLFTSLLVFYYLGGFLPTDRFLGNFSNEALVTLVLLLLVSITLEKVHLITQIAPFVTRNSSERFAILKLSAISTLFSAFLNNTAVVAMLMSALKNQKHIKPSKLLIPLSYFAIAGGTITLIGTSTNLIVNSFVLDAGLESLKMFDFFAVGAMIALAVTLVVTLIAPKVLPDVATDENTSTEYFLEAKISDDSSLCAKSVAENGLRNLEHLFLAEIIRGERLISPVTPDTILEAKDVLVFTGDILHVETLRRFSGLELYKDKTSLSKSNLVETVVSHDSTLVDKTIKEVDFRAKFDAAVVALRRGDEKLSGKMAQQVLYAGDRLVLAVGNDFHRRTNLRKNFYIISDIEAKNHLSEKEGWMALGAFALVIGLSAAGIFSLLKGLLLLLGFYLLKGLIGLNEMKRLFPFDLIIIIGSALGIASTLQNSGVASDLAHILNILFFQYGAYGAFVGIFLLTVIMTEFMTNNAAAALVFPIAFATAESFGVSQWPFIMAVAYGASASFLSPFGYQTNLMVYSVGGYSLKDFFKIGLPVSMTYITVAILMIPLIFPF
jgi:di/tricarboxylate transporter